MEGFGRHNGRQHLRIVLQLANRHGKQCYRESDGNGRLLPGSVLDACWAYVDSVELIAIPKDAFEGGEVLPIFPHHVHDLGIRKVFWNGIIQLNSIGILVLWVLFRQERLKEGQLIRVRFVEHDDLPIQVLPAHLDTMLNSGRVVDHGRPFSTKVKRETAVLLRRALARTHLGTLTRYVSNL